MTHSGCNTSTDELLSWWLDELDDEDDQRLDEHLFTCHACARRLQALVALGEAIRHETRHGAFGFVVPGGFVERMKRAGLTVREYPLAPGGSVNCTIGPDDDFVVSTLAAPLRGVARLDLIVDDDTIGQARLTDVPFNAEAEGVTMVPSAEFLRSLGVSVQRVQLVAVEPAGERLLGEYEFRHRPHGAGPA